MQATVGLNPFLSAIIFSIGFSEFNEKCTYSEFLVNVVKSWPGRSMGSGPFGALPGLYKSNTLLVVSVRM